MAVKCLQAHPIPSPGSVCRQGPEHLLFNNPWLSKLNAVAPPSPWLIPPSLSLKCQSDTAHAILGTHCKLVWDVDLIFFLHIQWQSRERYSVTTFEDDDFMTIKFWLSTYLIEGAYTYLRFWAWDELGTEKMMRINESTLLWSKGSRGQRKLPR